MSEPSLALHGGAGTLRSASASEREAIESALAALLERGLAALAAGASALDVVESAVAALEDDPHFNAGRGSSLTADGRVEMDASLMDGSTRAAGAVACVARVANPIAAARLVMERSPHVLLAGPEADRFALAHGAREAAPGSLVVDARRRELARALAARAGGAEPDGPGGGTVGAVARDARGHLAAATSTGGIAGKLPGRVGDSPLLGAGTWADDAGCAVSGTGHGEAFVRSALAHEVDALVRLRGAPLGPACDAALARVAALGRAGGCIALAREGPPALRFLTEAMPRAWLDAGGAARVALYADA